MWLKICGITTEDDGRLASSLGADAVGFVFWPGSRRFVAPARAASIAAALPAGIERVGVFVDQEPDAIEAIASEVGLDAVQLHGKGVNHGTSACLVDARRFERETAERSERVPGLRLIAALSIGPDFDVAAVDAVPRDVTILLDAADRGTPGGTGRTIDWDVAARVACRRPTILAGGLNPENVAHAIRTVRPYGVDVASGVELPARPGVKDPDRLGRFVAAVRRAEVMAR